MKHFGFILPASLALALSAQTNSPPADADAGPPPAASPATVRTNAPPANATLTDRAPKEIFSDSANFDLKTRIAVFIGHVRVTDPQLKMTCGIMTARVPESGKIDSIVAEQDVVIDGVDNQGRPVHATGEKAVYSYRATDSVTNDTVVLTGHPEVKSKMFTGSGETITWDRINNGVSVTGGYHGGYHMVIPREVREPTNAPAPSAPTEAK